MFTSMGQLVSFLAMSGPFMPFLVIYVVGAVLSLRRWRHHPARSRYAFFAFVLFLARVLASIAQKWVWLRQDDFGWDALTLGINLGVIGIIDVLIAIVGWILMLMALFARLEVSDPNVGLDGEATSGANEARS